MNELLLGEKELQDKIDKFIARKNRIFGDSIFLNDSDTITDFTSTRNSSNQVF